MKKMIKQKNKKTWFKKYCIIFLVLILLSLSFLYGLAVGIKNYPPYNFLRTLYKQFEKKEKLETIDPFYLETKVSSLVAIESENDLISKRDELIQFIWSNQGFPYSKMPSKIEQDFSDERYSDSGNLKRINKITVMMDYDLNSIIYHFHPIKENRKLMIYHQGHGGDFIEGKKTIDFFLDKGYSVMAFSMPLLGMNNQPVVNLERFGKLKLENHEMLKFLKSDQTHPIKFFLEPIVVSLNAVEELNYERIFMIGFSGGGWTTTLYSAIDPRISRSYPVAGSLPIYLRTAENDRGDYEQTLFDLYQVANYLELYVLGSYGEGRKQIQVLNKYDTCCFFGTKYQTYEEEIKKIVFNLGKGEFKVYLDDSHKEHKISDRALEMVINDLENY